MALYLSMFSWNRVMLIIKNPSWLHQRRLILMKPCQFQWVNDSNSRRMWESSYWKLFESWAHFTLPVVSCRLVVCSILSSHNIHTCVSCSHIPFIYCPMTSGSSRQFAGCNTELHTFVVACTWERAQEFPCLWRIKGQRLEWTNECQNRITPLL